MVTVPKGVGKDYQTAQDLWRAAGLHVAPATDATGAHRLPVLDSNWVVLAQDLKAGAKVKKGSIITATVTKYTDQKASAVKKTNAAMVIVPNGVGKDYQTAQDLWRAAGLHVAPASDATGAHRLPVLDSNWVVLAQDLKAGTKVKRDSFITATVKKYSDG